MAAADAHGPGERFLWWRIGRVTVEPAFRLAFRVRITGSDHIPESAGAILAANHVSVLDPVFVSLAAARRGRPVRFLALEEAFDQPLVGWALRRLRQVPLRRGSGDWAAIDEVARLVRTGLLTGISPEGPVGDGTTLQPGQKGVARIALASGAPIVPVGLWGSQERWPKDGLTLRRPVRPTVVVNVGAPIRPEGDPRSPADVRAVRDLVMEAIGELVAEARDHHRAVGRTSATAPRRTAFSPAADHILSADGPPPEVARPPARDPFGQLHALLRRHGDFAPYRAGRETAYLVNHPTYIRHVLADNAANYSKETSINGAFREAVADGLLTSEGPVWRRQRRMMQPAFQRDRLTALAAGMMEEIVVTRDRWDHLADTGEIVDMTEEMGSLTLRITARGLFGADLAEQAEGIGRGIGEAMSHLRGPDHPEFQEPKAHVYDLAARIVAEHGEGGDPPDVLSLLLRARDGGDGEALTPVEVRDQVITLLVAGYETTANAMSWTWYLLSEHPEASRSLRGELEAVLAGRVPDAGSMARLPYSRMVIEESMRMYPPAWILGRRALAEDRLGDHVVPEGSVVAISPYLVHRHPSFWEEPERFDPLRFTPDRVSARTPFSYIPFGAGPRLCIGHNLAMIEAQLILATLGQRFAPRLVADHPVVPERRFVLRPKGGLPMKVDRAPT